MPLLEATGACVPYSFPKAHHSHDKNEGVSYLRVRLGAGKACVLMQIGMCPSMSGSVWGREPPQHFQTYSAIPTGACRGSQLRLKHGSCTQAALATLALHRGELSLDNCLVKRYGTTRPSSAGRRWSQRQEPSWLLCKAIAPISAKTQLESPFPQPLESCFCVRQQSSAPVSKHKHP